MIQIFTASWSTELPEGVFRVSISRSAPRGAAAGWRAYKPLAPGRWFSSVSVEEYLRRYRDEVLGMLDPQQVVRDLEKLTGGAPAVLLCFEQPAACNRGETFCHRHLAALWLEHRLGITVPEAGFKTFDRFGALRALTLPEPDYHEK